MKVGLLTPNLERRLNALVAINDKKEILNDHENATITLSRPYGCEAYPLANLLMEKLNLLDKKEWVVYDKNLLHEISVNENISESFLEHIGDSSRFMDFMASFENNPTHSEAYKKIIEYIGKVAMKGNAIIIGRGSSIITKDLPNCYHYRIEAPMQMRIDSISKRMGMSESDAKTFVEMKQREREDFIESYFNVDIGDIQYYDAIFNQQRLSLDEMSDIIISHINANKLHAVAA